MTEPLPNKITNALDKSLALDDDTLDRLAEARQNALASIAQQKSRKAYYWLGGALSASLLAAFIIVVPLNTSKTPAIELAEMEWLMESDELEMLANDLNFYQWAEAELEVPTS